MIVWAWQELLDEDWTSLQAKHELSGVVPMTLGVRAIFLMRWLFRDREPRSRRNDDDYDRDFGGDGDDSR
jgi:hypothetical protein